MYRRVDVERVLRIKELILGEGLTLAGVRRRLTDESPAASGASASAPEVSALLDAEARESLRDVRRGLQWILGVVTGHAAEATQEFALAPPAAQAASVNGASSQSSHSVSAKPPAKPAKKTTRKK